MVQQTSCFYPSILKHQHYPCNFPHRRLTFRHGRYSNPHVSPVADKQISDADPDFCVNEDEKHMSENETDNESSDEGCDEASEIDEEAYFQLAIRTSGKSILKMVLYL